jgi:hypothetical protein
MFLPMSLTILFGNRSLQFINLKESCELPLSPDGKWNLNRGTFLWKKKFDIVEPSAFTRSYKTLYTRPALWKINKE